jgi:choline dehydrogenase-like flavoprotein
VWLTDQPSLRTAMTPENLALFEAEGRGALTSGFSEGGAFIRTRPELDAPDIQFHFGGAAAPREGADPPIPHDGYSILVTPLRPTSRGQVTLRNALPHAKPRILHNYYTTDDDTRTIIDGTRVALEIASRPALRKLRTADSAVPESGSDADILRFVRHNTRTIFHPVGTCAMGAVVDAELRVHGVECLRVVDASVMPTVPRGNTNAPTIMIAEKAADLIRGLAPLPRITAAALAAEV